MAPWLWPMPTPPLKEKTSRPFHRGIGSAAELGSRTVGSTSMVIE